MVIQNVKHNWLYIYLSKYDLLLSLDKMNFPLSLAFFVILSSMLSSIPGQSFSVAIKSDLSLSLVDVSLRQCLSFWGPITIMYWVTGENELDDLSTSFLSSATFWSELFANSFQLPRQANAKKMLEISFYNI